MRIFGALAGALALLFVASCALGADAPAEQWFTYGGQYRFRVESLDEPAFGLRPIDDYTAVDHRWFLHADLHVPAGPRLFVQLSAADEHGREPRSRPFDESAIDFAQLFVDYPITLGKNVILLRAGRQELDLHGNRLVAVREAANLRRAFDLGLVSWTRGNASLLMFSGRPVENRPGAFDDRRDRHEKFSGGSFELGVGAGKAGLFYFDRERPRATYLDYVGPERRRTFGVRYMRTATSYDVALQASYQGGDAGAKRIRAYGIAGDLGLRRPQWPLQPRFGLSFGDASGDARVGDHSLGTFDVIYPNLGYFTDAPLSYPGNTTDAQPNVTVQLSRAASMQTGCDFIFRNRHTDAVYDPPGIPLVPPGGRGSHVTTLCYMKSVWRPVSHVEVTAAYVHAATNAVLDQVNAVPANYWLAQVALKL